MSHSSASSDTGSDPLDMRGEEGWEDAEPDVEEIRVVSLFDDQVFPDVKQMIEDCKKRYNFDFTGIQKKLGVYFSLFPSECSVLLCSWSKSRVSTISPLDVAPFHIYLCFKSFVPRCMSHM